MPLIKITQVAGSGTDKKPLKAGRWLTIDINFPILKTEPNEGFEMSEKLPAGRHNVPRQRLLSAAARTRTAAKTSTGSRPTLNAHNTHQTSFAHKKKKHVSIHFSSSTKLCQLYLNLRLYYITLKHCPLPDSQRLLK